MELTDIAPLENWHELERKINKRSGMNTSVFDLDGIRIADFVKSRREIQLVSSGTSRIIPAVGPSNKNLFL